PAVLASAGSAISAWSSRTEPRPPRYFPSPPEPGRNSWRAKNNGKRTSVTSTLPNLIPPAACPSPAVGQPSPAGEAPPPGRAWNMCQMKGRPVRGSFPWMAMRVRLGKVDHQVRALLPHGGPDVDVLDAVAVVVEDGLAPVDPVLPAGDAGPRLALGAVEDRLDGLGRHRGAVLGEEGEEPPLAH